jgi:hypothetical protein
VDGSAGVGSGGKSGRGGCSDGAGGVDGGGGGGALMVDGGISSLARPPLTPPPPSPLLQHGRVPTGPRPRKDASNGGRARLLARDAHHCLHALGALGVLQVGKGVRVSFWRKRGPDRKEEGEHRGAQTLPSNRPESLSLFPLDVSPLLVHTPLPIHPWFYLLPPLAPSFRRPNDRAEESDAAREKFFIPESDHLTLLHVYQQWKNNGYRGDWCDRHYLHRWVGRKLGGGGGLEKRGRRRWARK